MNCSLKVLAFILIAAVLHPLAAYADSLNIATVDMSPYGYVKDGCPSGMVFEMGNAIAEKAGFSRNNEIVSLGAAIRKLESGAADMVITFPSKEMDAVGSRVTVVSLPGAVVMVRADTVLRSLRDLAGKRVATVRGAVYDKGQLHKAGLASIPAEDCAQALKLLLSQRVDGVIGPSSDLTHAIETNRLPKRAFGKTLPLSVEVGTLYLSSAVGPEERKRLVKAVNELMEDGTLSTLVEKYSF